MGVPLFLEVVAKPVTSFVICGCSAVWLYIQKRQLSYEDVGVSYEKVVTEGQYWRIASAAVSHISLIHLLFNMSAIWSLGDAEAFADVILVSADVGKESSRPNAPPGFKAVSDWIMPRAEYLKASVILALLSEVIALGIYHILVQYIKIERYRKVTGVGYSCVVFGWMTILSVQRPSTTLSMLGLVSLPVSYAPFESLVLTSVLVPNASFIGHLAGILVGYMLAWGVFSGLNLYWQLVLYFWLVLGGLYSLSSTGPLSLPFMQTESLLQLDPSAVSEELQPVLPLARRDPLDIV